MDDVQQAAQQARAYLTRVGGDGGVLHELETGERSLRDPLQAHVLQTFLESLGEQIRSAREVVDALTELSDERSGGW